MRRSRPIMPWFAILFTCGTLAGTALGAAPVAHQKSQTRPAVATMPAHVDDQSPTADFAHRLLVEGNNRYAAGSPRHPHEDAARRAETASQGQHPFVAVISCSDSRVPVELLFDSGVGDLFVIRVAGNVVDEDEIASAEYAAEHLQMPLLVVLGHTKCGAVTAAVSRTHVAGHLTHLLDKIAPAVTSAERSHPELHGNALLPYAIRENVWHTVQDLITGSEVLREFIREGKLRIEGAVYDIETGKVAWMGAHPRQRELLRQAAPQSAPATRQAEATEAGEPTMALSAAQATPAAEPLAQPVIIRVAPRTETAGAAAARSVSAPQAHASAGSRPSPTAAVLDEARLDRSVAMELQRRAADCIVRSEYEEAARYLRSALDLDPRLPDAAAELAALLYLQGDYALAAEFYAAALEAEPSCRRALRGSALAHAAMRQYAKAQALLERLLDIDRTDPQSWLELGDVLFLLGDNRAARMHWTQAAQAGSSSWGSKARLRLRAYPQETLGSPAGS